MATQVTGAGSVPAANTPQGALYRDVLARTGDPDVAAQAVANAQAGMREVYNEAMVRTGGDANAARAAQNQYGPDVYRLASLIPTIQGAGSGAGPALQQALGIMKKVAGTDPKSLYPWINQNVADDAALQAAGLDPAEVRAPPDTPWAHADLDALVSLARDMMTRYRSADGVALSTDQVEGYLDQARAAAQRYGVGAARVAGSAQAAAADSAVSLASLGIPLRV